MVHAVNFVTNLGSFTGLAQQWGPNMLLFGQYIVHYVIMSDFFQGRITPLVMLYVGTAVGITAELIAAAYILVKTTDAVISFT